MSVSDDLLNQPPRKRVFRISVSDTIPPKWQKFEKDQYDDPTEVALAFGRASRDMKAAALISEQYD